MADETNFDLGYNPLSSPEAVSVPSSPPDTVPAIPSIQTSHSKSQHVIQKIQQIYGKRKRKYYRVLGT